MSWRGWKQGFSIYEVPITFVERAQGVSKMSACVIREALVLPWRLRLQQRAETLHKMQLSGKE
jgi:dolichol-phosphate mannosyltransferase